jgi:hypothetical protein
VSIVFFQDDAELARLTAEPPAIPQPPARISTPNPVPAPTAAPACCPVARPVPAPIPSAATPARPAATPAPPPLRPAISILPTGAPLGRVEVLRGRPLAFWLRAFSGDAEVPVRSWTVVSGEVGTAEATSGPGSMPFRTSWPRMPLPDRTFELAFRIDVGGFGFAQRSVDAAMTVVVRSPALEG